MTVRVKDNSLDYDQGLREFMINMYNHTATGLALSGVVAYFTYYFGLYQMLFSSGLGLFFIFAPLGMILYYSFAGQNWNLKTMTAFYYLFTAIMGISLSAIFATYTSSSIAQVFFITSATFLTASLYGYTTSKDLTSLGSFLIIGLIGIIIAMIVNIFLGSPAIMFAISILGVIIFTGLTSWDTQNAKNIYLSVSDRETASKYGIQFALSLYLNFINLFQMLLNLLGERE